MNLKTIKKVLNKKFNDWVDSIDNEMVKKSVEKNTIITGGAIASMLLNEKIKDFDVYFKDKHTTFLVTNYYINKFKEKNKKDNIGIVDCEDFNIKDIENKEIRHLHISENDIKEKRIKIFIKSSGIAEEKSNITDDVFEDACEELEKENNIDDEKEKYRPIFFSQNAITLSNKIQIIVRFHGEPKEIHENYDFVHCTNYWTSENNELVLNQKALESLITKNLYYMGSKYPLCSVIRTRKFVKRGWHINAGQYLKMLYQLNKMSLDDINVLEDQLTGVDSAFFQHLIDGLRSKLENNKDFKIEDHYISKIIDKIFG